MRNKKQINLGKCFILMLSCLAILAMLPSCKAKTTTVIQTTVKTVTATVATTAAKTTAQPKLSSTTFSLSIVAPAEYASATVPVYITQNQTIHLNWSVVGGPIRMSFTSPNGKVGSVGKSGVTTSGAVVLDYMGEVKFCPTDSSNKSLEWGGAGYYYFIPNIIKGDLAAKVTISYWVEG
jgi:hypothetical protein